MADDLILLVEDNAQNVKLLRDVLQATGYRTLEASTGGEAVRLVAAQRPAVVLLDVRLPDASGVEVLRRLRADARTARVPIFAVTAQAMKGDAERFIAAGFDEYLAKPIDIDALLAAVAKHCQPAAAEVTRP